MNLDSKYKADQIGEFVTNANLTFAQNLQKIQGSKVNNQFALIVNLLNLQYDFALIYWSVAAMVVHYETGLLSVMVSAFYKNLFAFYAAVELTQKGLYGPARPILRYIFESLMIAKFCSVSRNQDLIQKWHNEEHIGLSNEVINKIKTPDNSGLKKFLRPLNSFTHATRSAQQILFNVDENWNEIYLNTILLKVLLECNYHVLNRHIVNPSAIYYVKEYGENLHDHAVKLKKELREKFSASRKDMPKEYKEVVRSFTQTWLIKT